MAKKKLKIFAIIIIQLIVIIMASNVYAAGSEIIVALDPGHGGNEPGASGGGLVEKDLTWKIATRVKEILDSTPGIKGVLTKENSETLGRYERTVNARNAGADLLVSFHINSSDTEIGKLSGAEAYVSHYTAKRRYYEYSSILASDVLTNLRNIGVHSYSSTPKVRIGSPEDRYDDGTVADYYGIISWPIHMDIPAVLIEHAFINNAYDRNYYLNDYMLNKMAEADAQAIIKDKDLFKREYYGQINTNLDSLNQITNAAGNRYLSGNIDIAEWVSNNCQTPFGMPKITLKSTDGKVNRNVYISYLGGIRYYFDVNIENIDMNKEYYFEVELTSDRNISSRDKKVQRTYLPNKVLNKNFNNRELKIINNRIVFSEGEYSGDIQANILELNPIYNSAGDKYISGNVNIEEIVNGKSRTARTVPEIRLKSTDGKVNVATYISYQDGTKYYFDKDIQNLDTTKEYYLEAALKTEDNISKNKTQKLEIKDNDNLLEYNDMKIISKNNNLICTYMGGINTNLYDLNIIQNAKGENYISGNIEIAEWVEKLNQNSECRKPTTTPKITLKSTDGEISKKAYISHLNWIKYYFDVNVQNLDKSKEYYLEVELTNPNNVIDESKKVEKANINVHKIVKGNGYSLNINNNIIKIINENQYYGNINTNLQDIHILKTASNLDYIQGKIDIAEWVNGNCNKPTTTPKLTLKSTDGKYQTQMYISYMYGITYYFDKCVEGLDTSKEYYIEAKLTSNDNLSSDVNKTQTAKIGKKGQIGLLRNGDKVVVQNNNIIKISPNTYYGTVNTNLQDIHILKTESNLDYIQGKIDIAEWVNGNCNEPQGTPKMTLKSTDGTVSTNMYISHLNYINYYFDKCIEGIDESKEYYIEVELTGRNNIADKSVKTQKANIGKQGQIGILKNGSTVNVNKNIITIIPKNKINTKISS